jgi:hypothetical protein
MVQILAGTMVLVFATGCLLYLVPEQRQLFEDVPADEAFSEMKVQCAGKR